jgi:ribosomal protein L13
MLPKNRLRKLRLDRLKVFAADETPYDINISRSFV